ncbi:MAG: DnaJ domain-containing protein [Bdellovibrionota bacterium]
MRIVLFCLFAPLAMMEALFYRQFNLTILGTLYLGLCMQADFAAGRFLRDGLRKRGDAPARRRHWSEDEPVREEEPPELKVRPLGDRRWHAPPPSREPVQPAPPLAERRRAPARRPFPPAPNFQGSAHEVLGVAENAATRTIVNAFRHWVKRFHPDHAPILPLAEANAKVRQLAGAKELLLDRRRGKKAA